MNQSQPSSVGALLLTIGGLQFSTVNQFGDKFLCAAA